MEESTKFTTELGENGFINLPKIFDNFKIGSKLL